MLLAQRDHQAQLDLVELLAQLVDLDPLVLLEQLEWVLMELQRE